MRAGPASPQINDLIVAMAKKGMKPSEIGVNLRDQHGVPLVRFATCVPRRAARGRIAGGRSERRE